MLRNRQIFIAVVNSKMEMDEPLLIDMTPGNLPDCVKVEKMAQEA